VAGNAALVQSLRAVKMPWSVNRLAIEAGYYICRHPERMALPVQRLLEETASLQQSIQAVTGWNVRPTATHYFLVNTNGAMTAASLKWLLIRQHGILIRDAANFRGLTPAHFRIACQPPAQNQLLIEALSQCSRTGI
jgi:threonine-phosphate decarboxylase